jgi:hypothetical protein
VLLLCVNCLLQQALMAFRALVGFGIPAATVSCSCRVHFMASSFSCLEVTLWGGANAMAHPIAY